VGPDALQNVDRALKVFDYLHQAREIESFVFGDLGNVAQRPNATLFHEAPRLAYRLDSGHIAPSFRKGGSQMPIPTSYVHHARLSPDSDLSQQVVH